MSKRILLAAAIAAALVCIGCSPSGSYDTSTPDRFVRVDSSGIQGSNVYVDTVTNVEYVYCGYSMTPLVDADGKPLKYDAER